MNLVDTIYNRLPQVYQDMDRRHGYALRRFIEVVVDGGLQLLYDKAFQFQDIFDPDKTDSNLLPYLASMLGFEFPAFVSEKQKRRLLKNLTQVLRLTGTKPGLVYLSSSLFGLGTRVTEQYSRILILNSSPHAIWPGRIKSRLYHPDDRTFYMPGSKYHFKAFEVWIDVPSDHKLDMSMSLMKQIIEQYSPAHTIPILTIRSIFVDAYEVNRHADDYTTIDVIG